MPNDAYNALWNDFVNETLEESYDYQKSVKKGYPERKNAILTGGKKPVKTGKPFVVNPPKERSKSAPPGAGVFQESIDQEHWIGSVVFVKPLNVYGVVEDKIEEGGQYTYQVSYWDKNNNAVKASNGAPSGWHRADELYDQEGLTESSGMSSGAIAGSVNNNVFGLSDEEMGR